MTFSGTVIGIINSENEIGDISQNGGADKAKLKQILTSK